MKKQRQTRKPVDFKLFGPVLVLKQWDLEHFSMFYKALLTYNRMFQSKNFEKKIQYYLAQDPANSSLMTQAEWSFIAAHWCAWGFILMIFSK